METATVSEKVELASVEDVNSLAERIGNTDLCEFFSGYRQACEAETMVAQTIRAARINAKEHGEPFAFKGDGVHTRGHGGIVDNATAYARLVAEDFFVEDERQEKPAIFPTKKLAKRLDAFFAWKATR